MNGKDLWGELLGTLGPKKPAKDSGDQWYRFGWKPIRHLGPCDRQGTYHVSVDKAWPDTVVFETSARWGRDTSWRGISFHTWQVTIGLGWWHIVAWVRYNFRAVWPRRTSEQP